VTTSQLPWPESYLTPSAWHGVGRLLTRCLELAASGVLPGTLMLVGEAGLGREALAIELAAALVCRGQVGAGCACSACERVRRGVHPDVVVLDVLPDKKQISIDQARGVVDTIAQRPYEGLRRVFILNSCHTPPLNAEAASALLKTLEEPPAHATFLLLASNPARVLPTIVSRAVQLKVPTPTREELLEVLALAQGCGPERAAALLVAADGDAELALRGGEDLPESLTNLQTLISAALRPEGLAILRAASMLRQAPAGVALATAVLLHLAARSDVESAENFLEAAAALLTAEDRRAVLHLDPESVVVATLARAAARRSGGGQVEEPARRR
jgi:DNA polymerase III delta prime subunit